MIDWFYVCMGMVVTCVVAAFHIARLHLRNRGLQLAVEAQHETITEMRARIWPMGHSYGCRILACHRTATEHEPTGSNRNTLCKFHYDMELSWFEHNVKRSLRARAESRAESLAEFEAGCG